MKRMLCFVMSLVLCFSMVMPIFAAETESVEAERLILIAKEKLSMDDSLVEFRNYHFNESENGKLYHLYWSNKEDMTYRDISVTIGDDGIITHFYDNEEKAEEKPSFKKYTKDEALVAAKTFIEIIDKEKLAFLDEGEITRNYDGSYGVSFNRLHQGIPVANNRIYLEVDGDTLKIIGYSSNWQKLTFKEDNFITEEEAQKAFTEKMGYDLFYQIVSEDYENTARLIYRNRYDEAVMIDAVTGETITLEKMYELARNEKAMLESAVVSMGGSASVALSDVEKELVEKISAMLSKEKADAVAKKVSEFSIDKDFKIENYSIFRRETGEYVISLFYRKESKDKDGETIYKEVTILAENGQVVGYSSRRYLAYDEEPSKKADMSKESLQKKAESFLKKYYSQEFSQMSEKEFFNEQKGRFEYQRLVNGTRVYNNGASLSFNTKTGELISFNLQWTEADFPLPETAKNRDEANKKAMESGSFGLRYIPIADGDKTITAEPVYSLQEQVILAAENLEKLDYALRPDVEQAVPVYVDVAGHYAEEKIKELLADEIYLPADEKGALHPDEAITQLDFLLLLDKVIWKRGYEADQEEMYRNLIRQGVLLRNEKAPDSFVTRMDGITWLIRALGYGEFVKIPGIFRCPFPDVMAESEGVAAVAGGLGLIHGDNGNFYPGNQLKKAEAMVIIYNYMAR